MTIDGPERRSRVRVTKRTTMSVSPKRLHNLYFTEGSTRDEEIIELGLRDGEVDFTNLNPCRQTER